MTQITRATAQSFCRACLMELGFVARQGQEPHKIQSEKNVIKWLSIVAATNSKAWTQQQEHPNYLCHSCFMKVRTCYEFREKVTVHTETLQDLMKENPPEAVLKNLQKFCRGCLNPLKVHTTTSMNAQEVSDWMLHSIGVRIGAHVMPEEQHFPTQLCNLCIKKLCNFVEFRRIARNSLAYLKIVLDNGEEYHSKLEEEKEKKEKEAEAEAMVKTATDMSGLVSSAPLEIRKQLVESFKDAKQVSNGDTRCEGQTRTKRRVLNGASKAESKNTESVIVDTNCTNGITCDIPLSVDNGMVKKLSGIRRRDKRKRKRLKSSKNKIKSAKQPRKTEISDENREKGGATENSVSLRNNKKKSTTEADASTNEHVTLSTDVSDRKRPRSVVPESRKTQTTKNKLDDSEKRYKNISCDKCEKKFRKRILYEAHVQRDHEGNDRPYNCVHCSMTFGLFHVLRRHLQESHAVAGVDEEKQECAICSKQFKRKEHLRNHLRIVHQRLRPFKCSYCDKSFGSRKVCRVHEMCHTGRRPYKCEYCAKSFRQTAYLKSHLERHTTAPELLCPICKRAKGSTEELQQHIVEHNQRMLQCAKCSKMFRKKSHLSAHEDAVHLKLRPFKCNYCEQCFALRTTCRTHERIHFKNKKPKEVKQTPK